MKLFRRYVVLVGVVLPLLLVPLPTQANTGATTCIVASIVVAQQAAPLRAGPGTEYPTVGQAVPAAELPVVTYQGDGNDCWYQIQQGDLLGWIAGDAVAPQQRTGAPSSPSTGTAPATDPSPAGHAPIPAPSPVMPHSHASPTAWPSPAGDPSTLPPTFPSVPPHDRRVRVRVCLDTNANQFCDVGDGISGMAVFALHGLDGTVLAWGRTDPDGVAHLLVPGADDAPLIVNIPYLGTFDQVRDDQPVTRTVPFTPALPGLIP